jgi:hypothetical protein
MNRLYARFVDRSVNPECWLFPGVLALVLSVSAFLPRSVVRDADSTSDTLASRNRNTGYFIATLWIILGFVGSLGIHTFFYRFLFSYAPGFKAVRVPARWAEIAYVGIAMLIAFAVARVAHRHRWPAIVVAVLLCLELRAAPIRWYAVSPEPPEVHRWLSGRNVRIAQLPIDQGEIEYVYMYWSTRHHRPMVNGVSGFSPPEMLRLTTMWKSDPIDSNFISELRRIGVDLIVLQGDYATSRERTWLRQELGAGRLGYVRRFDHAIGGDWVFDLQGGSSTAPQLDAFLRGEATCNHSTFGPSTTRDLEKGCHRKHFSRVGPCHRGASGESTSSSRTGRCAIRLPW